MVHENSARSGRRNISRRRGKSAITIRGRSKQMQKRKSCGLRRRASFLSAAWVVSEAQYVIGGYIIKY